MLKGKVSEIDKGDDRFCDKISKVWFPSFEICIVLLWILDLETLPKSIFVVNNLNFGPKIVTWLLLGDIEISEPFESEKTTSEKIISKLPGSLLLVKFKLTTFPVPGFIDSLVDEITTTLIILSPISLVLIVWFPTRSVNECPGLNCIALLLNWRSNWNAEISSVFENAIPTEKSSSTDTGSDEIFIEFWLNNIWLPIIKNIKRKFFKLLF